MASKKDCTEVDYSYYHKVMEKIFPTYNYNPQLMTKPTTEFVLDILHMFFIFYHDLSKNIPISILKPDDREENVPYIAPDSPWKLLGECNRILRDFNFGSEGPGLFTVPDIVAPDHATADRVMFLLNICFHIHELDFTVPFAQIQQILAEHALIQNPEVLIARKRKIEVASACVQDKLDKIKSTEEMERLYNMDVAKCEAREKQLKQELDASQSTLLLRKNALKKFQEANNKLEDKLIDEKHVEQLKSELEDLKLKKDIQSTEADDLTNKINNTKLSKEFFEHQLNVMTNSKEIVEMQKEHLNSVDELKAKLEKNLHMNADLDVQIDNYKREILLANDSKTEGNYEENLQVSLRKTKADIREANKKIAQLKSDGNKDSRTVKEYLTEMDIKYKRCVTLRANIEEMDKEVKLIHEEMLTEALKKF